MIFVFLANGFEEIEAVTVIDILRRCGTDVKTVGIDSKAISGSHNITIMCDAADNDISVNDDVSAIVFPGGMPGTLNLEKSQTVQNFIDFALDKNILICAICAAPIILGHRNLLNGKEATCFPGFEEELGNPELSDKKVCKDGNIITSRAAGTAMDFAFCIAKEFVGEEKASAVRESMIW